jgi:predicted transcriptional regulator
MAQPAPTIFDDIDTDAEAEADIAAGRVISHGAVRAWLRSWGTADELPTPRVGD